MTNTLVRPKPLAPGCEGVTRDALCRSYDGSAEIRDACWHSRDGLAEIVMHRVTLSGIPVTVWLKL
jgi:hypothetical protein